MRLSRVVLALLVTSLALPGAAGAATEPETSPPTAAARSEADAAGGPVAGLRTPERDVMRLRPEERGRTRWECDAVCQERQTRRRELRRRVASLAPDASPVPAATGAR